VGRRRVVVLAGVGEDEGVGVRAAALHLLPRRTPLGAAAPVVSPVRSRNRAAGGEIGLLRRRREADGEGEGILDDRPWVGRALDGLLAVLAPRPHVRRRAVRRNVADHLLHLVLPGVRGNRVSSLQKIRAFNLPKKETIQRTAAVSRARAAKRTFSWILARHRAPAARSAAPSPERGAPGVAPRPPLPQPAAEAAVAAGEAAALELALALAEAEAGEAGRLTGP
jgi:hypothetical protein